jgi:5-methylcytosine-specific restriction endonuclease McrA
MLVRLTYRQLSRRERLRRHRLYHAQHRERSNARRKAWRIAHPERNKATIARTKKAWVSRNGERIRRTKKRWRRTYQAIQTAINATRRAKKFVENASDSAAIRKIYTRCQELRQWFDVVVDHRIPLCRGGLHQPSNLQIIYRSDNLKKGSSLTYVPSVIFS